MGWFSRLLGKREKTEEAAKTEPTESPPVEGVEMAKDLVCGMNVEPAKAAATSDYEGKTYYFCAVGCKKAFDEDPAKYLTGEVKGDMP